MIGQTISHYKILEKLPTTFLKDGTPSGQFGGGGMSQNGPRTFYESGCRFENPAERSESGRREL